MSSIAPKGVKTTDIILNKKAKITPATGIAQNRFLPKNRQKHPQRTSPCTSVLGTLHLRVFFILREGLFFIFPISRFFFLLEGGLNCDTVRTLLLLLGGDLPVDEHCEYRTKHDDYTEYQKLLELSDDNRVYYLRTHFKLKRKRKASSKCDNRILTLVPLVLHTSEIVNKNLKSAEYYDRYTYYFKGMYRDLRNKMKHVLIAFKNFIQHFSSSFLFE